MKGKGLDTWTLVFLSLFFFFFTPCCFLDNMSLLKQRGRELERFDGLSLIYWYVNATRLEARKKRAQIHWDVVNVDKRAQPKRQT